MKYAALLTNHADAVAAWEAMSPEEAAAARAEEVPQWNALFAELGASGALGALANPQLDTPRTARTVRVRDGETLVTDGPFAETKEQIGGLMVARMTRTWTRRSRSRPGSRSSSAPPSS